MKLAVARFVVALFALPCAPLAGAHHSYADYEPDERYVFSGTLTELQWGNPHILLFVSDAERTMRIEWITVTGAELTQVEKTQFSTGERIVVTGSRNRDSKVPIMTLIKQIELPDDRWRWERPTRRSSL